MALLEIRSLTISRGSGNTPTTLVGPISFTVDPGERVALLGPSGSGKSLTASAVLGTLPSTLTHAGEILFAGANLAGVPLARRGGAASRIAFVHQDPHRALNPQTTIGAHLARALSGAPGTGASPEGRRLSPAAPEVLSLLERLAFTDPERIATSLPHELSGGQRQRACIALALARRPQLLVADEPTTALDSVTQNQVLALLSEVLPEDCALLFITHDLAAVRMLGARVLRIANGEIQNAETEANVGPLDAPAPRQPLPSLSPAHTPASAPALFSARDLEVVYAGRRGAAGWPVKWGREQGRGRRLPALTGATLNIEDGERLGIVGASGSGKSTLISTLLGLRAPTSGTVRFRGEALEAMDAGALREFRRDVQYVPQDARGSLNPRARVLEQVMEPLRFLSAGTGATESGAKWRTRSEELLASLHVDEELWGKKPHEISGGQAQRVALARALATRPSALIADEPLSGLDPQLRARIEAALAHVLGHNDSMGLILVSHDLDSVLRLCSRVVVLEAGRIVADVPTSEVGEAPARSALGRLVAAHEASAGHAHV